jgi:hypothetical protein
VLSISDITGTQLTGIIAAIGALGTAAFGLVDAFKALPGGGPSRAGFKYIRETMSKLVPDDPAFSNTGLNPKSIESTLMSQWINGAATADQVNIAKSLIKLRLSPTTASALASATGVDANILTQVAQNISTATPFNQAQSDIYGRFDLMITTLLDQAYQRADQRYRNTAKAWAMVTAVILAAVANKFLSPPMETGVAILVGLLATPVAPVAKDLASAIQTASQTMQAVKKV